MDSMGIGTLAKRAGVRIDTVRYYEKNGLLTPRSRLASGYRRYGELEVARLRFIRRAQAKLDDVNERIAALEKMRDGLATLIAACPGHGRAEQCPILNTLGGDEPA